MQTADVFEMQISNAVCQIDIWSYVGRKMHHQAAKPGPAYEMMSCRHYFRNNYQVPIIVVETCSSGRLVLIASCVALLDIRHENPPSPHATRSIDPSR